MEDTLNKVEEMRVQGDALSEANGHLQSAVDELGKILVRRLQMNNGQFNPLELEIRLFVAIEQVNVLSDLMKSLLPIDDARLTELTAQRVQATTKAFQEALSAAPRLVVPPAGAGRGLNGTKHN
jgi:hypothetical protein